MTTNAVVKVSPGEPVTMALKRLSKALGKDGFFRDVKRHECHVKPGDMLRRKKVIAAKYRKKRAAKLIDPLESTPRRFS